MNNNLKRKDNETNDEYQVRLTLLKQSGIDIDWSEIAELVGDGRSSEAYRKDSYGIRRCNNVKRNDSDNETLLEIRKEKVKLSDLRIETNKQIRNLARTENVIALIKDEINKLNEQSPLFNKFRLKKEVSGNDGVLLFGDWHFGMTCDNSVNKYDIDVCKNRIDEIIDKSIKYGIDNNIDKLHIICLGDMLSGIIHSTIQRANQEEISQQIVQVSELLSEAIAKLSDHFYCTVTMVQGNHDAVDMNKHDRTNKNNYNSLTKEFVKIRIQDLTNVILLDNTINNDEIGVLNVKNKTLICCHGDKINKMKVDSELEMVTKVKPDIICYGHVHNPQYYSLYETDVFVNGSLISTDEYAMNKKLYTPASQTLLIVNEDGVLANYVIKVE